MKRFGLILLITLFLAPQPSIAGSENETAGDSPSVWGRAWNDFKADWINIGNGIKESGTQVGRTFKEEFKSMPDSVRQGVDDAKRDFRKMTGSKPSTAND